MVARHFPVHLWNGERPPRLPSLAFIGFMSCILYGIYITCINACIHVYMYTYIVNFKISINFKISWWRIDTFTEMMYFMHFSNNEYAFFCLFDCCFVTRSVTVYFIICCILLCWVRNDLIKMINQSINIDLQAVWSSVYINKRFEKDWLYPFSKPS